MQIIYNKIKSFETIIVHGHTHSDGDCYGSQLGLKDIITTNFPQKKVYVVGETNPFFSFLGNMDEIDDSLYQNALAIVVDCGQESKISDVRFKLAKEIIRIDHHLLEDHYGNYEWVDPSYSSCSQMIFDFKKKFNMNLTEKGAYAMYVGIVTDTGNFCFDRVNRNTLNAAASLLLPKFNVSEISYQIKKEKINLFKCKAYIYKKVITSKGFVYAWIPQEKLKKFNLQINDVARLVNILNYLENHPVWAFFMEQEDHTIRVCIRSRGPEIHHIAKQFKGGGHIKACGATLDSRKQLPLFIEKIKKSIITFKKEQIAINGCYNDK